MQDALGVLVARDFSFSSGHSRKTNVYAFSNLLYGIAGLLSEDTDELPNRKKIPTAISSHTSYNARWLTQWSTESSTPGRVEGTWRDDPVLDSAWAERICLRERRTFFSLTIHRQLFRTICFHLFTSKPGEKRRHAA
ncbi:hypothetical protein KM043_001391 [Ampulex compressa]|nr:hypothetical protein KM043_001391 [Ampulex compressa]